MRRLITRIATAAHMAGFAVILLTVGLPFFLFKLGVDTIRDRIEGRWPDSDRARAVSWWFGCLAPVVMMVVMLILLAVVALRVRALREARGLP